MYEELPGNLYRFSCSSVGEVISSVTQCPQLTTRNDVIVPTILFCFLAWLSAEFIVLLNKKIDKGVDMSTFL